MWEQGGAGVGGNDEILVINAGSSSVKFAVFVRTAGERRPRRTGGGVVERIGTPGMTVRADGAPTPATKSAGTSFADAARLVITWMKSRKDAGKILGIGHRVVHGGLREAKHALVDEHLLMELRRARPLDLAHLPREIELMETFAQEFKGVPQVACFDSAFHAAMPTVAKMYGIPRKYYAAGVRRLGFHGLSYAYLMEELERVAGREAAMGKVILAHLGSGASMAAVRGGTPMDTTMGFTPTAGLVMGTRPGDMDAGLLLYLMRAERMNAEQADAFINEQCGLLGVAETTYDMRELSRKRATGDVRAAEAMALFSYSARKWIAALAAVMGGVETLVFAGGIGEHATDVRSEICAGLDFLGIRLDEKRNAASEAPISREGSPVAVRVIKTDEEVMIAQITEGLAAQNLAPAE